MCLSFPGTLSQSQESILCTVAQPGGRKCCSSPATKQPGRRFLGLSSIPNRSLWQTSFSLSPHLTYFKSYKSALVFMQGSSMVIQVRQGKSCMGSWHSRETPCGPWMQEWDSETTQGEASSTKSGTLPLSIPLLTIQPLLFNLNYHPSLCNQAVS